MPFTEEHEAEAEAVEHEVAQSGHADAMRRPPRGEGGCEGCRARRMKRQHREDQGARARADGRRRAQSVRAQRSAARRRLRRECRGILVEVAWSDRISADAGVVQSRVQLERLVADDELAGRTIAGFAAQSVWHALDRSRRRDARAPRPARRRCRRHAARARGAASRATCARRSGRARSGIACARRTAT